MLQAYPARDSETRARVERALRLLDASGDPFRRTHFQPGHFTASAFVLAPDSRSVLLILHGKLGRWLQPGGHFEPEDSDLWSAARRECAEEVGLEDLEPAAPGLFDLDIHPIPAHGSEPSHEHFDLRVLLRARHRDARAGSDARAAKWVELAALDRVDTDASVLRALAPLR